MIFTLEIKIPREALVYRAYLDFPSRQSAKNFGIRVKKKIEESDNYKGAVVTKKMSAGNVGLEAKEGSYFLNSMITSIYERSCISREACEKGQVKRRVILDKVTTIKPAKITKGVVAKDDIASQRKMADVELSRRRKKIEDSISDIIHAILFCHFDIKTAFVLINELKVLLVRRHALKHRILEPTHYNTKRMNRLFGDKIVYGSKLVLVDEKSGMMDKFINIFKRG